ncbi:MAG: aspartate 1-decarboxylase [Deltaproteobacteria bacterium]|nr:aspartate 1-decarboxylase [Deltaproteobacteria bacterium]MCL5792533.1 aspartate 1-decarboxylase [Deltaproteobacteria bacterium]
MERTMLKSKIHRAFVTEADLSYEGSITIDEELMELADLKEYELVKIWDVSNGNRLETYTIKGEKGTGIICINGAAAHLIRKGDTVIIASFVNMPESDIPADYAPRVLYMEGRNIIKSTKNIPAVSVA